MHVKRSWLALFLAVLLVGGVWLTRSFRVSATGSAETRLAPGNAKPLGASVDPERSQTGSRGVATAKLPKFTPEPAVPRFQPSAFLEFRANRFNPEISPEALFEREERSERWAPEMEKALTARFDAASLQRLGIPGLRVDKAECRASACRVEVSWSEQDEAAARATPGQIVHDPLTLLTSYTGPFAAIDARLDPKVGEMVEPRSWAVGRRNDGRYSVNTVLLFSERNIDPIDYRAWVDRTMAKLNTKTDFIR